MKKIVLGNKSKKVISILITVALFALCTMPVFANTITGVSEIDNAANGLITLFSGLAKIVGVVMAIWGVISIVNAQNAHDASQRTSGILLALSGVVIFFVTEILAVIGISL